MPHAPDGQARGTLRHDDAAQGADVRLRRDLSEPRECARGLVRVYGVGRQSLSEQAGDRGAHGVPPRRSAGVPPLRPFPRGCRAGLSGVRRKRARDRSLGWKARTVPCCGRYPASPCTARRSSSTPISSVPVPTGRGCSPALRNLNRQGGRAAPAPLCKEES